MAKFDLYQSTDLFKGGNSLLKYLLIHLYQLPRDPFSMTQIVVPSQAMGLWLKQQITTKSTAGICANIDCVVLLGPVIERIYTENNPDHIMFNFDHAVFTLYEILLNFPWSEHLPQLNDLYNYLQKNHQLDLVKVYQLAQQLQQLFFEYLFMRTDALLSGKLWQQDPELAWQKIFWNRLVDHIHNKLNQVLFSDVYQYFMTQVPTKLPKQLIIFALPTLAIAQAQIINRLSKFINITWFHLALSNDYYGDLLDVKTRNKLERKMLGYPELSLEDLSLMDGNPLLANLGQQSREMVEILLRELEFPEMQFISEADLTQVPHSLALIQQDIRQLKYRLDPKLRLKELAEDLLHTPLEYADPIELFPDDNSISIKICHNRMREIQTAFNFIAEELAQNNCQLDEILLAAPDIDEYAPYIQAVFNEEYVLGTNQEKVHIPYNITGNRKQRTQTILETIQLFLEIPFKLPVTYLLDVLSNTNIMYQLDLSADNIQQIKIWLRDNNTHFAYDNNDCNSLNLADDWYSLKRLVHNLMLGLCLPSSAFSNQNQTFEYLGAYPVLPYDNLDFNEGRILAKLISLIDLIVLIRNQFYYDETNYKQFTVEEFRQLVSEIKQVIFPQAEDEIELDNFLASSGINNTSEKINLPIIRQLVADYLRLGKGSVFFNGSLTCASLNNMRNIPFKVIYIVGLNDGEFPRNFTPNQLSFLTKQWFIGDRNYTLEDKQIFLDTVLAAQDKLVLSYIGREATTNKEINASKVVTLLLECLKQSFILTDEQKKLYLQQIQQLQSLHPFYKNSAVHYAGFWQQIIQLTRDNVADQRWDIHQGINFELLTPEQWQKIFKPAIKDLVNCLCYNNNSLKRILNLNDYDNSIELDDLEELEYQNLTSAKQLFNLFQTHAQQIVAKYNTDNLLNSAYKSGLIASGKLGKLQLEKYWQLYKVYQLYSNGNQYQFNLNLANLTIQGSIVVNTNQQVYILPPFNRIKFRSLIGSRSKINEKSGLDWNFLMQFIVYSACLAHPNLQLFNEQGMQITLNQAIKVQMVNFSYDDGVFTPLELNYNLKDPLTCLDLIENFYLKSCQELTLIHKGLIREIKDNNYNYSVLSYKLAHKLAYSDDYYDSDIQKIHNDVLWGDYTNDYQQYLQSSKWDSLQALAEIYQQVIKTC
jgi:exodeoxyribonuclease V gamma subunit